MEQHLETQKVMVCRFCRNTTAFELKGYYETTKQTDTFTTQYRNQIYEIGNYEVKYWSLWQCLTCSEPTLIYSQKTAQRPGANDRERFYIRHGDEDKFPRVIFVDDKYYEDILEEPQTKIIYPIAASVPLPSDDMPPEIAKDYIEARAIFEASARSSAALLRLAIQKLCKHLGQPGKNINDDISALVKKGLPQEVQQALDFVRVIGNNAVHPGEIDIRDNPDVALAMFEMMNYIIEVMITRPRIANEFYEKLPPNIRKSIHNRDNR